jgi:hypothetical protein
LGNSVGDCAQFCRNSIDLGAKLAKGSAEGQWNNGVEFTDGRAVASLVATVVSISHVEGANRTRCHFDNKVRVRDLRKGSVKNADKMMNLGTLSRLSVLLGVLR